jgi:hypothetical protein
MGIEDGIGEAAEQTKKIVTGDNEDERQDDENDNADEADNANMEYER